MSAAVRLVVTAGPHAGKEFAFDRHDTFLVGRHSDAHLQLSYDDPYFSRRHFLIEVNPPRVRVIDLGSRNGIFVNDQKVETAELKHGDEIKAGHTVFRVVVPSPDPDRQVTLDLPPEVDADESRLVSLMMRWMDRADLGEEVSAEAICPPTARHLLAELRGRIGEQKQMRQLMAGARDRKRPPDEPPVIPGYQLGTELGRGGMGVVYRAVRAADGAAVAVKTITPAAGVSDKQVRRFVREARVLAELSHPHVVAHLDSGTAGGLVYLVMELVEGTDAARMVTKDGPLPVRTAVRMACQMLAGLAHAHAGGFVHRDVKPANLLIGDTGRSRVAKVADFGLARAYDECQLSGLTMQGEVGGTPAYMAPEQVTHFREVKPTADQYSAAATLYCLLTGKTPHDLPKEVSRQLAVIANAPPVPLRDRRADVPADLAAVVHRGLARDPAGRFPDVTAFRTALKAFAT